MSTTGKELVVYKEKPGQTSAKAKQTNASRKQGARGGGGRPGPQPGREIIVDKGTVRHEPSRKLRPGAIRGGAGKVNSYYQSIADPWNVVGARVPDLVTTPSIPLRWVYRTALQALGSGDFGFTLNLINVLQNFTSNAFNLNIQVLASIASGAYTWGAASIFPNQLSIANNYQFVRIVSAGLVLRNDSAFTADQGRMGAVYQPFSPGAFATSGGGAGAPQSPPGSWAAGMALPYSIDVPASTRLIEVKYIPMDPSCYNYGLASSNATTIVGLPDCGNLVVLGNGMAAAAPVDVELVINFEVIPIASGVTVAAGTGEASFISSSASPSWADPLALADAANRCAAFPAIALQQPLADVIRGTPFRSTSQQVAPPLNPWIERVKNLVRTGVRVARFAAPVLGGLATALSES
jgi:hypothetical protein